MLHVIHAWSYDFYDLTLSTELTRRHMTYLNSLHFSSAFLDIEVTNCSYSRPNGGAQVMQPETSFLARLSSTRSSSQSPIQLLAAVSVAPDHTFHICVISKSKGPCEILRDIRTSTYQMCRTEENTNQTTKFHK